MNKELEEVKEYLEHEVKVYENNKEINQLIGGKLGEKQHKINKTILNYIDNSISKEVIEKKYKEAENEVIRIREENIKNNNATKYDYLKIGKRDAYKEVLEGK